MNLSPRAQSRYKKIMEVGLDVILRHGYERVTMEDIATESGISRVALYRYFQSKEDVLCALVAELNDDMNAQAKAAVDSKAHFQERLFNALDVRLGKIQRLLAQGSHGAEISNATHRITGEITTEADNAFLDVITQLFKTADRNGEVALGRCGLSAKEYAELCVFSAKGLMRGAGDVVLIKNYDAMLRKLVSLIWVAIGIE